MRVQASLSENVYQYYQQTQYTGGGGAYPIRRDISDFLDREIRRKADPKQQILADYCDWKARQPTRFLPKSRGATEENLAYLHRCFSGKLDLLERIEAVDTMCEMGMLTEEQMLNYLGLGESTIRVITKDTPHIQFIPAGVSQEMGCWIEFFGTSPIGFCDDLDKLLDILDVRMRFEGQKNVAEQIQAILSRTANKSVM